MWGSGPIPERGEITVAGTYIDLKANPDPVYNAGERGKVAVALELPWGPDGEPVAVSSEDFVRRCPEIFGYESTDVEMKMLSEVFRHASTAYVYRLNSGAKASGKLGTAACSGSLGNRITVVVEPDPDKEPVENPLKNAKVSFNSSADTINAAVSKLPSGATIAVELEHDGLPVGADELKKKAITIGTDNASVKFLVGSADGSWNIKVFAVQNGIKTLISTCTATVTNNPATERYVVLSQGESKPGTAVESAEATFKFADNTIDVEFSNVPEGYEADVRVKGKIGLLGWTPGRLEKSGGGTKFQVIYYPGAPVTGEMTVEALLKKDGTTVLSSHTYTAAVEGEDKEASVTATYSKATAETQPATVEGGWIVRTMARGQQADVQYVFNASYLNDNCFVAFDKTAKLEATAGDVFAGGSDGETTTQGHIDALNSFESLGFNILACASTDTAVQDLYISYVKRMRDEEGIRFQVVMPYVSGRQMPNHEGVIMYGNDVEEGREKLAYWLAGAEAECLAEQSIVAMAYDGALTVKANVTRAEQKSAIKNGIILLHTEGSDILVMNDINTLTTIEAEFVGKKNLEFRQNQNIRVIDERAQGISRIFNSFFLGKMPNDEIGRVMLKTQLIKHAENMAQRRAIQPYDVDAFDIHMGDNIREVGAEEEIQPINCMEVLKMRISVGFGF